MNTIVIPVFNPVIFEWLGERSVLDRAMAKLEDIRDIGRVMIIAADSMAEDSHLNHSDSRYGLLFTPPAAPLMSLLPRLLQSVPSDVYVLLNPLYPFLDRGNIEQALYLTDEETAVVTTHGEYCLGPTGLVGQSVQRGGSFVEACVSVRKEPLLLGCGGVHLGMLGNKVRHIPISDLETICIGTEEGLRIAEAAVSMGLT